MSIAPRFQPSRKSGFTLIEILIALVVLFIGIVGIIALFPIGIKSTRLSVEDTNAALIAESIHHAIIIAMRNAVGGIAWIEHDGCPIAVTLPYSGKVAYDFHFNDPGLGPIPALPLFEHHPAAPLGPGAYSTPGGGPEIFQLGRASEGAGGTDTILKVIEDIRGNTIGTPPSGDTGSDVTIDYNQYFWDFMVGQVTDGAVPVANRLPLYEFRIRVWRAYQNGLGPEQWKQGEAPPLGVGGDVPDNMIQEFRVLVASNS